MRILSHRGYWNSKVERNSLPALKTALEKGYGFESDVRDYMGKLVISHNIADNTSPDAEQVFKWLSEYNDKFCFAINIKSDGLKDILRAYIEKYSVKNYFLFDMSVPQMVEFEDMGLRFFTRQSEFEIEPCMYNKAAGVWIDGFNGTEWITERLLRDHTDNNKEVCLVSPELHGKKDYRDFWNRIRNFNMDFSKILLCTDVPDEAKEFFYEK